MSVTHIEWVGAILFAFAILHTFSAGFFQKLANRYPSGSIAENICHFLGEVEVVFGLWAAVFIAAYALLEGYAIYDETHHLVGGAIYYLEHQNFTEPLFVFVIMTMAATRPIILIAEKAILAVSQLLPLPKNMAFFVSTLVIGPLLGSLITEPAAMTVTAFILLDYFYSKKMSTLFKYATLGLLFVNISVGGTLSHFAAPPVLMVASKWNWDLAFMMEHFGFKAILSVLISTAIVAFIFRKDLKGAVTADPDKSKKLLQPAWWVTLVHIVFMALVVMNAHYMVVFCGLFLFFIGFVTVTKEYQDELKLRESLLVGFFLAGLVVLGSIQQWWLKDILLKMNDVALYFGAATLTAVTDNAALTYLGSLVELSDSAKYALVAGAVSGGGLTVIANAPNPAGYGILKSSFKDNTISPLYLFLAALGPTIIVCLCFQLLPSL